MRKLCTFLAKPIVRVAVSKCLSILSVVVPNLWLMSRMTIPGAVDGPTLRVLAISCFCYALAELIGEEDRPEASDSNETGSTGSL